MKALTLKERRFVDGYLGSCAGNGKRAAIAAGYAGGHAAEVTASRLLRKAEVKAAVAARTKVDRRQSIASADERDRILTAIARNPALGPYAQALAIKELNKCSGRHSIKHVLDVTEKLGDIIAGSREGVGHG